MKDLSNNISPAVSLAVAVRTAAANGTGVDLQGYESATALVDVGAEGDTLSSSVFFEVSLEHSDDDSTYTDVAQADIIDGTIASGGIFLKLDGTAGGDPDSAGGILCWWKKIFESSISKNWYTFKWYTFRCYDCQRTC